MSTKPNQTSGVELEDALACVHPLTTLLCRHPKSSRQPTVQRRNVAIQTRLPVPVGTWQKEAWAGGSHNTNATIQLCTNLAMYLLYDYMGLLALYRPHLGPGKL